MYKDDLPFPQKILFHPREDEHNIISSKYHVTIFQLFTNCTNDNPLVHIEWNKARSSPIHPVRAVPPFSCTSTQSYTSRSLHHVEDDLPSGVTLFHLFVGFVCLHKRKLFVNNRSDLKYKTRMINFSFIHSYSIKNDICFPSTVLRFFFHSLLKFISLSLL